MKTPSGAQADTIAFVGGGQMAGAMIKGLLRAGTDAASIVAVDPAQQQRESLSSALGVRTAASADDSVAGAGVVVWATKPQVLRQAIDQARERFSASTLHVSIAAGIPVQALGDWLQSQRVVRAMPNMAALVGAGVTGMVAASAVSEADRQRAAEVLAATGSCFWVENDERLDAVTAVSGSGPAYVFHFLEAFQAAAQELGFAEEIARDLVLKTAVGAIEQAKLGEPFGTLRARVTSKRGTTEAALQVFDDRAVPKAVVDAVRAAYERAGELSRELTGQSA
jgi:pyrroline-5-carboxylate reductase